MLKSYCCVWDELVGGINSFWYFPNTFTTSGYKFSERLSKEGGGEMEGGGTK